MLRWPVPSFPVWRETRDSAQPRPSSLLVVDIFPINFFVRSFDMYTQRSGALRAADLLYLVLVFFIWLYGEFERIEPNSAIRERSRDLSTANGRGKGRWKNEWTRPRLVVWSASALARFALASYKARRRRRESIEAKEEIPASAQ